MLDHWRAPTVIFRVTGAGTCTDLKEALNRVGSSASAHFSDYARWASIGDLCAEADVALMTGLAESLGNPSTEAHAVRRPIVTSPVSVAL